MRLSSSNTSSRRGLSGHPGRAQRRARPASTEQKNLSTGDTDSRKRLSDDIEMISEPMSNIAGLENRFASLPPTVPAPGSPEEVPQIFHSGRRLQSSPIDEAPGPQTSLMPTEERVLAPPPTVFPCALKQSFKVPVVSLPTPEALSGSQDSIKRSTSIPSTLPNPSENPSLHGQSPLHLQGGFHEPLPPSLNFISDSAPDSPFLSPDLPGIISPEAQRRLNPKPLHPSFPSSSPMTSTTPQPKPAPHRRLTPYPTRKDATEIRRDFPATDPSVFRSSDGKIVSIAAEIAAAQHRLVTEQELAERRKFGNAMRFGRPRPRISRIGSRKSEGEREREREMDEGGSGGDEDEREEGWEIVGKERGG